MGRRNSGGGEKVWEALPITGAECFVPNKLSVDQSYGQLFSEVRVTSFHTGSQSNNGAELGKCCKDLIMLHPPAAPHLKG